MLISHPAQGKLASKSLEKHLANVAEASFSKINHTRLDLKYFKRKNISRLSFLIGLFHDFGKATTWFQNYLKKKQKKSGYTNHSLISALCCFYVVKQEFKDSDNWELLAYLGYNIIKKHHGNLEAFICDNSPHGSQFVEKQLQNIKTKNYAEITKIYYQHNLKLDFINSINLEEFTEFLEDSEDLIEELEEAKALEYFFLTNFLFSILIDYDKLDAARLLENKYFSGNLKEEQTSIADYLVHQRKLHPEKFNPDTPINRLRNQFLQEIITNKNIDPENHFYSITAPTGIGKTYGCLAFANKLKNQLDKGQGRVIYCLPYTSIIDQNYLEFEKIIKFHKKESYNQRPTRYLCKDHYQTVKTIVSRESQDKSYKKYLDDKLLLESWESAVVVTTFVQFFHTLIGYRNKFLKKFHNLANSIVILDEVQNISPHYYGLLKKCLQEFGQKFNTYFLLITATQPEIIPKNSINNLVHTNKYMQSPVFDRVTLLVDKNIITAENFVDNLQVELGQENCLIVVNTINQAIEIYNSVKETFSQHEIYCLTTNLVPKDRNFQINEIRQKLKNQEKIIVVSTQLVEAGVDISFKNVYRDLAPLDSIIQVAGRCNRNGEYGKHGGKMHLVNLDNHKIYEKILIQLVKELLIKQTYYSKDFNNLVTKYYSKLQFAGKSNQLLKAVKNLEYDKSYYNETTVSDFKLIEDENKQSIYLLTDEEAQANMEKLVELKDNLSSQKLLVSEKNEMRLQLELLKYKLNKYRISLYPNYLTPYYDIIEPEEYQIDKTYPYPYISYQKQKDLYDKKTGFLSEPKTQIDDNLIL